MFREVVQVITSHRQTEGGGFVVRRPFPTRGFAHADPFRLLDEMGPVEYLQAGQFAVLGAGDTVPFGAIDHAAPPPQGEHT